MRKTSWRTPVGHRDFQMAMRGEAVTQRNPELKELDKRSAELDGPDVENDQKELE